MKELAEEPIAVVIKKEAIETCLVESDDDNSMVNSSAVFVNKCDFDNKYLVEVLDKVSEREDSKHSDNVASNIVDPFLRDIIKQCTHEFSSSSTSKLENCQITSQDEHLVVGSTKCESPAPNFGVLSMLQHHINLPTELRQKYGQPKMQFEEIISFDRRDALLVSVENSTEFIESDCEKSGSFSENDRRLVGNRKNGFSDSHLNERIVSLVSQFKASDSLESHDNFADGWHHGCTDKNNCSGAICNQESLDIGSDRKCSMVNENCGGLVSQSMQPLLNCIISQMDHIIPPVDKLVSVDAPYSMTEAISPYVRPLHEGTEQASHYHGGFTTTENLLEVVEWDPQIEKLMPSSQVLMSNRCSEERPCTVVSDLTDSVNPSGQILCHRSVSQLHDIQAKNTVADLSASSSLESSTQICEERQITMHSTKKKATDMMFGGNFCSEVEHSPKKLFSNRKEISPNSQEKLLRALNNGGLDDVVKLSYCMKKLCFDKGATKSPSFSVLDDGETFFETEQTIKKQKTMNQSLPEVTKGILKSPDTICSNPYCLKNSSIHAQVHDAILFSQRQMQDTENIATKLLKGLNSLKSIVEETIFSEGLNSSPSKFNFDEIRLATKHASKLEVTTKKWLAMMAKDCTRFCKIMRLAENKLASPVNDLHKGRKKITFADEAGGALCQIKIYQQEPVAFIVPKS
ncbi:uncharacterized protein LOC110026606 [Phalaenopsis equestris]|uniref:uncharacterized protein LOC110026606 n=1 Tax=Phalaenopsis equestris TaxID=78828 RepID=UPI0009E47B8F|nr:uncharacterized protein LOC110026606 [Phalaenopsis equestris]